MTPDETLAELGRIGATLERVGERLRCTATKGAMTPGLRAAFVEHRDWLLEAVALPKVSEESRKLPKVPQRHSVHLNIDDQNRYDNHYRKSESISSPGVQTHAPPGTHAPACKEQRPETRKLSDFRQDASECVCHKEVTIAESPKTTFGDFRQPPKLSVALSSAPRPACIHEPTLLVDPAAFPIPADPIPRVDPPDSWPTPKPWRAAVSVWPIPMRERWGRRSEELELTGMVWPESERQAFEEVKTGLGAS